MVEEKQIIEDFIKMSKSILPLDGLEGVEHYLEHGEYEMSYEGLAIELYTTGEYPTNFNFIKWKELGLDEETRRCCRITPDHWHY